MKNRFLHLLLLLFLLAGLQAQTTFIIESLPDYTPPDDILYIAGDFQGWDPGNPAYALQKNTEDMWYIEISNIPAGQTLQFKFTRGDWGTVEKGEFGEEIPNREFEMGSVDTAYFTILNWADNSGGNSTAAENVQVMDEDFFMPQLNRTRRIWLYLPPDYEQTTRDYPVIYMHDGQNLFDTYTSFAGEWEVDETLNHLHDDGYEVPIVVGIDNGGIERLNEYTPWINPDYGGGQGDAYIQFIIQTLKPYIDENYRTLPERENTGLWGSSLGGLISFYGVMKYPEVFQKGGIYSPSYWFSDSVWTFTQQMGHQQIMRMYQMTGGDEGGSMVEDTWAMQEELSSLGFGEEELSTSVMQGGQHNEFTWATDFGQAYLWLFQSFANRINDQSALVSFQVTPNPVATAIMIPIELQQQEIDVIIYDVCGRQMVSEKYQSATQIEINKLYPAVYFIEIIGRNTFWRGKFVKQ